MWFSFIINIIFIIRNNTRINYLFIEIGCVNKMDIMFVCTGNICRSAMAHALCEKRVIDSKKENINVFSCGVYAENNDMPTFNAIEATDEYNADLRKHRATNIKNSNIEKMDLILCATNSHKIAINDMYPNLKEKTYTLKEYVNFDKDGKDINIKDPWGYDLETYRFCAN